MSKAVAFGLVLISSFSAFAGESFQEFARCKVTKPSLQASSEISIQLSAPGLIENRKKQAAAMVFSLSLADGRKVDTYISMATGVALKVGQKMRLQVGEVDSPLSSTYSIEFSRGKGLLKHMEEQYVCEIDRRWLK